MRISSPKGTAELSRLQGSAQESKCAPNNIAPPRSPLSLTPDSNPVHYVHSVNPVGAQSAFVHSSHASWPSYSVRPCTARRFKISNLNLIVPACAMHSPLINTPIYRRAAIAPKLHQPFQRFLLHVPAISGIHCTVQPFASLPSWIRPPKPRTGLPVLFIATDIPVLYLCFSAAHLTSCCNFS